MWNITLRQDKVLRVITLELGWAPWTGNEVSSLNHTLSILAHTGHFAIPECSHKLLSWSDSWVGHRVCFRERWFSVHFVTCNEECNRTSGLLSSRPTMPDTRCGRAHLIFSNLSGFVGMRSGSGRPYRG